MKTFAKTMLSLLLIFGASGSFCPEPAEDILRVYNFVPLVPPSNMVTVGTVLALEDETVDGKEIEKLKVSCGPRASLGKDFIPTSSATVGRALSSKTDRSFRMSAEMLDSLKGDFDTSQVKSVDVTVTNARILSLSDSDVLENLHARSEECRRAIKTRLEQGYHLTMVNAALVADLLYKVEWKETANFDKKARLQQMQRLAASAGGGQSRVGLSRMESRGLALGVRTDAFLLALSVPEMDEKSAEIVQRSANERLEGLHPVKADAENPDAPYVLPHGGYAPVEFSFED